MASSVAPPPLVDSDLPAVPPPPARADRRPVLAWAAVGALVGAALVAVAHRGLIDDAYITFGYARDLAEHGRWGLISTETSNSATSPLNVVLLAAVSWVTSLVTGDVQPVQGFCVLTVVLAALLAGWAASAARRLGITTAWAAGVLAVVLVNPFVNSSLGMEVVLTATLMVGLLDAALRRRVVAFGVLAGLLVLTRLDLGVVVLVVFLLSPGVRRPWWAAPAVASAVALPWFVFSWLHFGSAIPDSFVIKTLQRSFGTATFANGLWQQWAPQGAAAVWLAVAPALLGVLVSLALVAAGVRRLARERWPVAGLGLGGVAYFAAYSLLGVPPYQWYYVPTTVSLGVAAVLGVGVLTTRRAARPSTVGRVLAVGVSLVLVALGIAVLPAGPLVWQRPTFFGNWALPTQYEAVGVQVGRLVGDATVEAPPEIGTLAFGCDCSMVDAFSDRGRTLPLIQARIDQAGPIGRALLEANFARLDRDQQPRPAQYRLIYTYDPPPPGVASWPVYSPATGNATLYLQPLP